MARSLGVGQARDPISGQFLPGGSVDPVKRFHKGYKKLDTGCWEWQRAVLKASGYGAINISTNRNKSKVVSTHRYSYMVHNGEIPAGLCVLHKCDNRRCVNPEHLYAGTPEDNVRDMDERGRRVNAQVFGIDHPNAKFNEDDIRYIRVSRRSARELAVFFETAEGNINKIKKRELWRHVI